MHQPLGLIPRRRPLRPKRNRWRYLAFTGLLFTSWGAFTVFSNPSTAPADTSVQLASVRNTNEDKVIRVGIQAGHWKNLELPDELEKLVYQSTGTSVNGVDEWEVCLNLAEKVKDILEKQDIVVDIIPATVPERYEADAFVSLHTDGNDDTSVSGFKVAPSYFDASNTAGDLSSALEEAYKEATHMEIDPNVTSNMTEYYAFNSIKFHHAIARTTPGALLEVGFLTNARDRSFLLNKDDVAAEAIATGIINFLHSRTQASPAP